MKISILQQDLLSPLQAVSRSVGIRSTLPVLANILLKTDQGKLTLSATNLEIGVVKKLSAQIEEEGEITIPAKILLEVVSTLTGNEITLESANDQLKITSQNFNAVINGISAAEFPQIPLASDKSITIKSSILKSAIPEIAFAAAQDEGRPVLTGILTEIKNNNFEVVATDGFRLAHKKTNIESKKETNFKTLIPRRTFEEVIRLITEDLKNEEDPVEISTSENQNQMIFTIGDTQLSSRLIEGNFPNWEKIIPIKFENKTIVDKLEFLKAVKISSVFARSEANIVKIETQEKSLKFSSEAKELGGQQTQIEALVEGSPIVIAFNTKFLTDALSATQATQVSIEFSGNLSPALIKPIGEEGLEYVVMPIRIS